MTTTAEAQTIRPHKLKFTTIPTERLILRPWHIEDEPELWEIFSDRRVVDPLGGSAATDRPQFTAHVLATSQKTEQFVAVHRDSNAVIGFIGYANCQIDERVMETVQYEYGYGLHHDHWGQGYGTEMALAIRDFLVNRMGAQTLWLKVFDFNPASEGIIKKCGFTYQFSISKVLKYLNDLEVRHRHFRLDIPKEHLSGYECLSDDQLDLLLMERRFANPEKNFMTSYVYSICLRGTDESIGYIDIRVGHNENTYYGGNIGYEVNEAHRGKGYAGRACQLVKSLGVAHQMDKLIITCNPDNIASRRTIEKLGLRFDGLVKLPEHNDMYLDGEREKCIYTWEI